MLRIILKNRARTNGIEHVFKANRFFNHLLLRVLRQAQIALSRLSTYSQHLIILGHSVASSTRRTSSSVSTRPEGATDCCHGLQPVGTGPILINPAPAGRRSPAASIKHVALVEVNPMRAEQP